MKIFISLSRNVANIDSIERYLNSILTNQSNVDKWIKSTLRRYIITELTSVKRYTETKDSDPQWLKDAVTRDKVYVVILRPAFKQDIEHAIGWLKTFPETKQINVNVQEAIKQGNILIYSQNLLAKDREGTIKTLYEFADGYSIVNCLDDQALKREGKLMQHCVGSEQQSYIQRVGKGTLEIWSLRDKQNNPHCTIEYEPKEKKVKQIKGKQNAGVVQKYQHYVVEWLENAKRQSLIDDFNKNDLINIGILNQDGVWYDLYNLPRNFELKSDLDLSEFEIDVKFPDGLKITESLLLPMTKIKSLPDKLSVGEDLDVSDTFLNRLPDNLSVGRDLEIANTEIESLSKNLFVGRDILASHSKLKSLPENLEVERDLNISYTNIEALPDNLTVRRNLYLYGTKILKLPETLRVESGIYVTQSDLNFIIPDHLASKIKIMPRPIFVA